MDHYLPGQRLRIFPHGHEEEARICDVLQGSLDGIEMSVGVHSRLALSPLTMELHRVVLDGKPRGPWIERETGGHFEVEMWPAAPPVMPPTLVRCLFCEFSGFVGELRAHSATCAQHPMAQRIRDLEQKLREEQDANKSLYADLMEAWRKEGKVP